MNKQEKTNLHLASFAIFISVISIVYTIYNDYNIRKVSFDNSGLQNRPILNFEENLNKIHYTLKPKGHVTVEDLTPQKLENLVMTLTVDPELKVTNNGGSVAKVLCEVVTDKYTGLPEIRKKIFDNPELDSSYTVKLIEKFYKTLDVLPGKSHFIRLPHILNDINFDLNEFTIHYLIIYANEVGNVYDSYLWVRFKMVKPIQLNYTSDGKEFNILLDKEKLDGAIQVVDTHFSTYMYSRNESKRIFEITDQYTDTLLKNGQSNVK